MTGFGFLFGVSTISNTIHSINSNQPKETRENSRNKTLPGKVVRAGLHQASSLCLYCDIYNLSWHTQSLEFPVSFCLQFRIVCGEFSLPCYFWRSPCGRWQPAPGALRQIWPGKGGYHFMRYVRPTDYTALFQIEFQPPFPRL